MYVYKKQPNITLIELHLSKTCLQIHKWQTRSNTGIFLCRSEFDIISVRKRHFAVYHIGRSHSSEKMTSVNRKR